MTKANIVNEIARTTRIDKTAVISVVEEFMTVVKDSLAHGENTTLIIPAHNIPAFKPANSFKDEIAK